VSPCLSLAVLGLAAVLLVPASVSNVLHSFAVVQSLAHTIMKEVIFYIQFHTLLNLFITCNTPLLHCSILSFITKILYVSQISIR
jgi:hypothetical protein